ncbi:hypothetical protein A0J61_02383 [Choanephora cucurbitarum]|uniref:Uncharacterized protein n=1 Tax=Choanephora cucurbitarum TaxID=101091 RepID=A0A1C7NK98_9FUNG|nr:hypothetical protein A0J61_02383 [Choanephora cucurbitarum]
MDLPPVEVGFCSKQAVSSECCIKSSQTKNIESYDHPRALSYSTSIAKSDIKIAVFNCKSDSVKRRQWHDSLNIC